MAAALLAALFAMGVFSAGTVGAQAVECAGEVPCITFSPDDGIPGTVITFTGENLTEGDVHSIRAVFDDSAGADLPAVVATGTVGSDGGFTETITVTVPAMAGRQSDVSFVTENITTGTSTRDVDISGNFDVLLPTALTADITDVDNSVDRPIALTGTTFTVAQTVSFGVTHSAGESDIEAPADDTVESDSDFDTTLTIPAGTAAGTITVTATQEGDSEADPVAPRIVESVMITVTEASLEVNRGEIPNGRQVSITVSGENFPKGNVNFVTQGVGTDDEPDGDDEGAGNGTARLVGADDTTGAITRTVGVDGSFTHQLTFTDQDIGATFFIVATEANEGADDTPDDPDLIPNHIPGTEGTTANIMITTRVAAAAPVSGLNATPGNEQLFVSWNHSEGADDYNVRWRAHNAGSFDPADTADVTSNTHTITGLTGGMIYVVEVRPNKDNALTGVYSTTTGTPTMTPSRPPTVVDAEEDAILNTDKASTAVRLTIIGNGGQLGDVGPSDEIVINLDKFGLPSSIDEGDVTIDDDSNSANPRSVSVSGSNVTIQLDKFDSTQPNSDDANVIDASDKKITITIRDRAGITTPVKAGDYTVKVDAKDLSDKDGYDLDDANMMVSIIRSISVKPTSATRGTEITITGKGYSDGSAAVMAGDVSIGTADITDGSFALTVNNDLKVNNNSAFEKGPDGTDISARDGAGDKAGAAANHKIKATFTVEPESPNPGQEVTFTLADTEVTDTSSVTVSFGGVQASAATNTDDGKATTWKVTVPSDVRRGTISMSVKVGKADALSKNITIATNALEVVPTTVVPGQEISVTGSGFKGASTIAVGDVKIGSIAANTAELLVNNTGNVSFDVTVPDGVAAGETKVVATDAAGRVGETKITVTKAVLTLNPAEGLIGSDLVVSGVGFPANDLVLIKYNGNTVSTANTDAVGSFERTIVVPSGGGVSPGLTYDVMAESQINDVAVSASKKHKTPKPAVTLSSTTATAGSSLTVNGANFKGFIQVYRIEINTQNVSPVPAPATDQWGAFSATVQVPQLTPGRYAVKAIVEDTDGDSATEFLQIVAVVAAPASTVPADVFADLIADGSLSTVWHLDASTQSWTSFSTNPALADFNDLTMIRGNQVYVLIMSAAGEFQGKPLFAGTNQVFIP